MKIQLIHPPADEWYTGNPENDEIKELWAPPTGLAIIAQSIMRKHPGHKIEIIDGEHMDIEEIISRIDAKIVGTTFWYSKHHNALRISKEAKKKGAITILGGYLNGLHERILRNHNYVDFTVKGDGARAMPPLVAGKELQDIPNLVYRVGEEIKQNKVLPADKSIKFWLGEIVNLKIGSFIPISLVTGCIKAEELGRCSFCSMDDKLKIMNPNSVWNHLGFLYEKYGVASFMETGDSFMVGDYPEQILNARPETLNMLSFRRIYAGPEQINEHNVKTLKDLNVKQVFMAVESYNNKILANAGKNYITDNIEHTINLLKENGIRVQVPYMFGLPGESKETAQETLKFAKKLIKLDPDMAFLVGHAVPLPGTELFEYLRINHSAEYNSMTGGDLNKDDHFDYNALVNLQLKHRTSIDRPMLNNYIKRTKELAHDKEKRGCFGINK